MIRQIDEGKRRFCRSLVGCGLGRVLEWPCASRAVLALSGAACVTGCSDVTLHADVVIIGGGGAGLAGGVSGRTKTQRDSPGEGGGVRRQYGRQYRTLLGRGSCSTEKAGYRRLGRVVRRANASVGSRQIGFEACPYACSRSPFNALLARIDGDALQRRTDRELRRSHSVRISSPYRKRARLRPCSGDEGHPVGDRFEDEFSRDEPSDRQERRCDGSAGGEKIDLCGRTGRKGTGAGRRTSTSTFWPPGTA